MTPAEIKHLRAQLAIHQRNYVHYRMKARQHGGIELASIDTRMSIEDEEKAIERIEAELRAAGVEVEM